MPKFTVEVTFGLSSEIEPYFRFDQLETSAVEDFEDSSYISTVSLEVDGGHLTFVVEATDEDDAERVAHDLIYDGQEVEDSDGMTWLVQDVNHVIEPVEEPMDMSKALELVTAYLMDTDLPDELKEAFRFILARIPS